MIRNIVAVFAGLSAGMIWNFALIDLNMRVLYPPQTPFDMSDSAAFEQYLSSLPPQAFICVLLAHVGQAFFGGRVAARLSNEHYMIPVMIVGALSMVGGIVAFITIPGPNWLAIEFLLYLPLAYAAGRIETLRRGARPGVSPQ